VGRRVINRGLEITINRKTVASTELKSSNSRMNKSIDSQKFDFHSLNVVDLFIHYLRDLWVPNSTPLRQEHWNHSSTRVKAHDIAQAHSQQYSSLKYQRTSIYVPTQSLHHSHLVRQGTLLPPSWISCQMNVLNLRETNRVWAIAFSFWLL